MAAANDGLLPRVTKEKMYIPISIDIIVECELFVLLDVTLGKDPHANMVANRPLCDVTIRLAAVIRESANSSALCRVDKLRAKMAKA